MGLVVENTFRWPSERLLRVLPSVRVLVKRLCDEFPTELSEEYLLGEAMLGNKHLWVAYDKSEPDRAVAIGFTEMYNDPATGCRRALCIGVSGDRVREILPDILRLFDEWALERGAEECAFIGRFGWMPLLKEYGYRKTAVVMKRQLGDEANDTV